MINLQRLGKETQISKYTWKLTYLFISRWRRKGFKTNFIIREWRRCTIKTKKTTTKRAKLNPQKKKKKKNRSRIKSINSKKLLIRLRILLAQLKAGNNSKLLKNLNQTNTIFCISTIKPLKKVCHSLINSLL